MMRGERLTLRAIERGDLQRLQELESNTDLYMLANGAWNPTPSGAYEKRWQKSLEEEDRSSFAIVADDTMIGYCGLYFRDRRNGTASVGIAILDPGYISKGYGREALRLLIDWGFRVQNYRRLWLDTNASNVRAIRSYQACGFVQEGVLRQHVYSDGTYHDVVMMGLLRSEWEQRT